MNIEEKNKAAEKVKTNDIEKRNAEIVSKFTTLADGLHKSETEPELMTREQLAINANPVSA